MVSSLCACLKDEPVNREEEQQQPEEQQPVSYVLGTPVSYDTGIDGLSAICLSETGGSLLVAQDNGSVLEFDFEGNLLSDNAMPNPDGRAKVDLEGITLSGDGSIYMCEERFREVWKLSADHKAITLISDAGPREDQNEDNQGYEGIAAGPDGILYVANQSKPFRVYTYSLVTGTWGTAFDVSGAKSLSDIFYDKDDGTLWITDAKTQKLTQFRPDGTLLQSMDISFVNKPEGFCKDSSLKLMWFVCDKTNKIYKVSYN